MHGSIPTGGAVNQNRALIKPLLGMLWKGWGHTPHIPPQRMASRTCMAFVVLGGLSVLHYAGHGIKIREITPTTTRTARTLKVSPTRAMQGELFNYGEESPQVAFQSNGHPQHVVLVGGLTDGLLPVPYTQLLATTLDTMGWSLVQAQLSSAYQGYGVGSVDRDAKELALLASYLKAERGSRRIVIIGHSTGCQDLVRYTKQNKGNEDLPPLAGVILQGAVSDQEDAEQFPAMEQFRVSAKKLVSEGKGEDIVMRDFITSIGTPLTANRFVSLYTRRGDDDMFSSYLSDEELKDLLGHMESTPSLVLVSGKDQFVPPSIDLVELGERIASAMGPQAFSRVVENAVHNLKGDEQEGVTIIAEFIRSLG